MIITCALRRLAPIEISFSTNAYTFSLLPSGFSAYDGICLGLRAHLWYIISNMQKLENIVQINKSSIESSNDCVALIISQCKAAEMKHAVSCGSLVV